MGKRKIRLRKRRERAGKVEREFTVDEYLAGAPVCAECGHPTTGAARCDGCAAEHHEHMLMEESCE